MIVITLLPVALGLAESSGAQKPDRRANSGKLLSVKPEGGSNGCAAYGPGFAKIEGPETCVKIGGAVSIGVGSSSGQR